MIIGYIMAIFPYALARNSAKLCLEDLRPRQADADRTAAKCRILLFHLEIIALFIGTDIEGYG